MSALLAARSRSAAGLHQLIASAYWRLQAISFHLRAGVLLRIALSRGAKPMGSRGMWQ
jgi:hypothetical protein